jgi:hypothetical protein
MTKLKEGWWMNYLHKVKDIVGRELTPKEIAVVMRAYISSKTIEESAKEFK